MQPNNALSTTAAAEKIASRIDSQTTEALSIAPGGSLDFLNVSQIMEVAKIVAIAKQAIPPHLRENVGACLAVCIQASEWRMSPFAVANKSYVVNDRMAYEAQLVAAVILMRAPIKGRLKYKHTGEGPTRQCTCSATCDDGEVVEYTTPEIGKIKVKNSPLWNNDPDQQLCYFAARSLARRHFPDVILGVYTPDEMAEETTREVTPPKPTVAITDTPTPQLAELPQTPTAPVPATTQPKPEAQAEPEKPKPAAVADELPGQDTEQLRLAAVTRVNGLMAESGMSMGHFKARCVELKITEASTMLSKMTLEQLERVANDWPGFVGQPAASEESA